MLPITATTETGTSGCARTDASLSAASRATRAGSMSDFASAEGYTSPLPDELLTQCLWHSQYLDLLAQNADLAFDDAIFRDACAQLGFASESSQWIAGADARGCPRGMRAEEIMRIYEIFELLPEDAPKGNLLAIYLAAAGRLDLEHRRDLKQYP